MRRVASIVAGLLLLAANLVGCAATAPTHRIATFADAVALTMRNTTAAFEAVEQKYYDVQTARTIVRYDTTGFNPDAFQRFLPPEELEGRRQVIDGLKRYAETLAAIMSDEQLKEFDRQTKALGESLQKVNADVVKQKFLSKTPVDDKQIALFASAINALGRWFIEYKREKAVRQAVAEMDQHVAAICEMLMLDFGSSPLEAGPNARGLRAQLWNEYTEVLRLQDQFIRHNPVLSQEPVLKRAEIKQLAVLAAERGQADATMKAMQAAFGTLRATHAKLNEAFGKNTVELDHLLSNLIAEGKQIREFYERLTK